MRRVIVCGATVSRTLLTTTPQIRIRSSATCFMSRSTHAPTTPVNQISSMQSSSDTNSSPQHTLPSTTCDEGSSVSSVGHPLHPHPPPRFPYDLFAYVGQPLSNVYTDYPDTAQFIFNDVAANAGHQLIWIRVPSDGETEREKIRDFERQELRAGRWKRPYAHLVAAGRDINSASGKSQEWKGPKVVLNFDTPSRVECYRVVLTSEARSPDFNQPKDWEVHSVVGYPEMPSDDYIMETRRGYIRALG